MININIPPHNESKTWYRWFNVRVNTTLKSHFKFYLKHYSDHISVSLKSLRFECIGGGQLFLSDIGKKTAAQCGLQHGSQIVVSLRTDTVAAKQRVPMKALHVDNKPKAQRYTGEIWERRIAKEGRQCDL